MLHIFFRLSFIINLLMIDARRWVSLYGEKTSNYPKSSCLEIPYVLTTASCFQKCLGTLKIHYMFSYSKLGFQCMCCEDFTGVDLVSPQWISFIPAPCKDDYIAFDYTYTQVCLKYVSAPVTYPDAVNYCQSEGGDLIRLDDKLKHDILTEFLVPIANGSIINVWIQGKIVDNEWFFNDGSRMPSNFSAICPLLLDNSENETHLRARGSSAFSCWDMHPDRKYSFMCEYYRQFTIY